MPTVTVPPGCTGLDVKVAVMMISKSSTADAAAGLLAAHAGRLREAMEATK